MRYRVTAARVLSGYELKASYAYAAGDVLDDATAPEGHIDRLRASGALEEFPEPAPAPAARFPRNARSGRTDER